MRIKVLVNVVTQSGQYQQGEVNLPEAQAAELLGRGWAILAEETLAAPVSTERRRKLAVEIETAALGEPAETAAEPKGRRKQKGA
jgi:hypothetical protein